MDAPQTVAVTARSSSRTDEIRHAAAKLFELRGYSSTTMADIANAVGVLPGSLYHHFASKEDVALEIVAEFEREAGELAASLAARLNPDAPSDARSRLTSMADAVAELSVHNRAALRLTAFAAPTTATDRFREAQEFKTPGLSRLWKRLVDDLVPNPAPETQDVGLLRFTLESLTMQTSVNTMDSSIPRSTDALHLRLLLDGIALDVPADDELDRSEAMSAARDAIAAWGSSDTAAEPNSREHIIAVARAEFARRGFDSTTVRDIAEAAQVRMGTLYRRVSSKEDLLSEILSTFDAHMDAAVRAVLTVGTSEVASLDAFTYVILVAKRRFRLETDIVKLANPWTSPDTPALKSYWSSTHARGRLLEDTLARGARKGSLRTVGAPAAVGPQIRLISWVPYQDYARTSPERAHRFLRNSLLRGFIGTR
ncbi:TetR/AcrR family transcriptional regulator [Microbacterium sp. P5_E9]